MDVKVIVVVVVEGLDFNCWECDAPVSTAFWRLMMMLSGSRATTLRVRTHFGNDKQGLRFVGPPHFFFCFFILNKNISFLNNSDQEFLL